MANRKSVLLFLAAFVFAGAILKAGTFNPTYRSAITPGGTSGGLGTIKSGGSSVTITPSSISAISDNAETESVGSITLTPSVPVNVTLTFKYQITSPGSSLVLWGADWFSGKFEYTDGTVKTFTQTFDIEDEIFVSIKAKGGTVSIDSLSVQ